MSEYFAIGVVPLLIILLISAGVSFGIPAFSYQYVNWKLEKKGKEPLGNEGIAQWRIICFVVFAAVAYLMVALIPTKELWLGIIFLGFALFGIIVDSRIRIIGNEMLLAMLPFGLIYRALTASTVGDAFLGSLLAMLMVGAFLYIAHLITWLHKKVRGVGMGDIKLSLLIALTLGVSGSLNFLLGLALGMLFYLSVRIIRNPKFLITIFHVNNTFPMCGPIMIGFLFALIFSDLQHIVFV